VAVLEKHPASLLACLSNGCLSAGTLTLAQRNSLEVLQLLLTFSKCSECLEGIRTWKHEDQGRVARGIVVRALDVEEGRTQVSLSTLLKDVLSHRWHKLAGS